MKSILLLLVIGLAIFVNLAEAAYYPYKNTSTVLIHQKLSRVETRRAILPRGPVKEIACANCFAEPVREIPCSNCGYQANNCDGDSCAALEHTGWGCSCRGASGPCGFCSCTDPGCGENPCLSAKRCCQVFGNIGASDFDFPCDCA